MTVVAETSLPSADSARRFRAGPAYLVTADPERVIALLDLASRPGGPAAAVYRASARAHHGADAAARRQILSVDAARFGSRDLSDRIAAVEIPDAPSLRWRVGWATGSQVHPGLLVFLDDSNGAWPPPVVAADGRGRLRRAREPAADSRPLHRRTAQRAALLVSFGNDIAVLHRR